MTNIDEDEQLPHYPKKLTKRFRASNKPKRAEPITGNGKIELYSTEPVSVVEYYLAIQKDEWAVETFNDYSYDLTRLLEYCAYAGIDDLSRLSSRDIEGFKEWRKQDGNIVLATLHGQLANIRVFLRFCERIEIVEEGLADGIKMPVLDDSDVVSYVRIRAEKANEIIEYHKEVMDVTQEVSREFAEFATMWYCLCRLGDVRSFDLVNYDEDENGEWYLETTHDPEEDTPLKNGAGGGDDVEEGGERKINVPEPLKQILDCYIESNRIKTEDEYGRKPLFTTSSGRVSKSTLRRDLYKITQPCRYEKECPYDKDPTECDAKNNIDKRSRCPSSLSPHPVRRGGICHQLAEGVPKDIICERADVSRRVLDKHYDLRTKEEARKQRREELKKRLDGYEYSTTEEQDMESNHLKSVQEISPLVANCVSAKNWCVERLSQSDVEVPSRTRAAKGLAMYAAFVTMLGINFALVWA